jgi:uncharacterized membrane protein
MLTGIALLTCIGSGTVGGVFFAFSAFVMKALTQLPTSQAITAMQRINVVVLNPLFLSVFVGSAVLAAVGVVMSLFHWNASRSSWLLASGLLYLVGSFFVTVAFNVPRNQRLARLYDSADASAYWPIYVREWSMWNHTRTAASISSALCSAAYLAF